MAQRKRRQLEQTVAALDARYGTGTVRPARDLARRLPAAVSTGFAQIDTLTGCGGVPLGWMTVLSGRSTSGKLTVAYKTLAAAQQRYARQTAVLVDLAQSADPDYLARAGIELTRLLVVRPALDRTVVDVLVELAQSRQVRLVAVQGLAELQGVRSVYCHLTASLGRLQQAVRAGACALLWVDDPAPVWQRWLQLDDSGPVRQAAALHIELQWEQWLAYPDGELCGYGAKARLLKSRWTRAGRSAAVEIVFESPATSARRQAGTGQGGGGSNGVIQARPTW
jgi:hypothetical protein